MEEIFRKIINEYGDTLRLLGNEKKCDTCKHYLPFDNFSKHRARKGGYQSKCKACFKEHYLLNIDKRKAYVKKMRKHINKKSGEYIKKSELNKRRNVAGSILRYAFKVGNLKKRNSCEICHTSPSQCHHDDYSKPLNIIELCKKCHSFLHIQYRKKGIKINY